MDPCSYYKMPYTQHSCNATAELLYYLLSRCVIVQSVQENLEDVSSLDCPIYSYITWI